MKQHDIGAAGKHRWIRIGLYTKRKIAGNASKPKAPGIDGIDLRLVDIDKSDRESLQGKTQTVKAPLPSYRRQSRNTAFHPPGP